MNDLSPLLDKTLTALERDVTCLLAESVKGLSAPRAGTLAAYIKLLRDILSDEKESEEALRKRVNEILLDLNRSGSAGSVKA